MLLPSLESRGSRQAIRIGEETLSYRELAAAASSYAANLLGDGAKRGDRIAIWATPDLPTLVAVVGNALAGLVTVPLNPHLGTGELAHILSDAAPLRILAAEPHRFQGNTEAIPLGGPPSRSLPEPDPGDPLLVLYTSGTTGAPKGAILSYGNAASNLDALAAAWGWTEEDELVHALPIFHVHGLVLGSFGSLRVGGGLELLPRFSSGAVVEAFAERGATMLFGVPTMYHRLAEELERGSARPEGLAAARLLISGSAALPVREHQRIHALLGQEVVERYGLTETLINCSMRWDGDRRKGSVGQPLPGVDLRLLGEGGELLVASDTLGEIAIRGPNVFSGYLNREAATAEAFDEEGYFRTGDLATRDADGFVRIVGRKATDLIKTGGFKVGAGEVESALLEHPDVREAAVIGVPDEDLGERIVAFVVPRQGSAPTHEVLADHVASWLSPHKRPRETHLVAALPRNAMGKVLKKELFRLPR